MDTLMQLHILFLKFSVWDFNNSASLTRVILSKMEMQNVSFGSDSNVFWYPTSQ